MLGEKAEIGLRDRADMSTSCQEAIFFRKERRMGKARTDVVFAGPDGYSNGPGTGAVIAPPSLTGPDGNLSAQAHGGHAWGAFTSDY